ncbi:hypothetical protein GCM10023328_07740 [Modestobacter marinus]|uniref:DUF3566 domain-containing protein n=1 Tax=Modestobacter marinus TaxID=477641 RepID=A0A846LN25_9ACTN|nr:DUF3566 domain-containing protein [Modestobacter marinus]NIH66805.1 hypothetical protein [Modestobacter marinus]GGL49287.1 hypothetical protein GCM10011589_02220 [Modestobacter marinus]
MSDRARSSVRTDSREGDGSADAVPEGATPVAGRSGSGTAPSSSSSSSKDGSRSSSGSPAEAPAKATQAAPAKAAPAKAAGDPAEGNGASSAGGAARAAAAGTSAAATPAAGSPAAGTAAAGRPPADEPSPAGGRGRGGAPAAGTPSAPGNRPAGAARGAAPRSGVPAAGSVPIDSTQAVGLPPAAARPIDTAARPEPARATPRPAASRPAGQGAGRTAPAAKGRSTANRGPRRARLQLRHIDTWSALKISLVLSIALFFVWMVAVGILYGVLSSLGVFDTVNDLVGQLATTTDATDGGGEVITAGVVFGGAAVIGAINIVLLTALCTVGTFVYNLCSDLVGGLEVTLAERD